MPHEPTRCGFVAVLGAPNVGKSTLVNQLVGSKVSIVSPKVQTTRTRVLGIFIDGPAQVVLIDTPGIFAPKRRLDRAMVAAAWSGADDADESILLIDGSGGGLAADSRRLVEKFVDTGRSATLVINKVDVAKKPALLELTARLTEKSVFSETFMISALTGDGVADLAAFLAAQAREGPWMFPEDQISDMPQRLFAAEITREKVYLQLRQELPYAATVETEAWTEKDDGSVRIDQIVYVERKTQKAIVLGKGGSRIKALGEAARKELEEHLDRRVHLFLFVRVRDRWGDDHERYRDWGLDFNA